MMVRTSGWQKTKLVEVAIKLLYLQEFKDKDVSLKRLININKEVDDMQEQRVIVSISTTQPYIDILKEMVAKSGWSRSRLMKAAIKLLYLQEFKGKEEMKVDNLVKIWETPV